MKVRRELVTRERVTRCMLALNEIDTLTLKRVEKMTTAPKNYRMFQNLTYNLAQTDPPHSDGVFCMCSMHRSFIAGVLLGMLIQSDIEEVSQLERMVGITAHENIDRINTNEPNNPDTVKDPEAGS